MTATLVAIPVLVFLAVFQSAVLSRFLLLRGTADLVLLAIIAWSLQKRVTTAWQWGIIGGLITGIYSALPLGVPMIGYLLTVFIALLLRRRIWQVPIFAMFVTVFIGTLVSHLLTIMALRLTGNPMSFFDAFNLVTLPSLLVNILFSLPIYALINELAGWLYPEELET
jgi:rod shape-determining protein MreD